LYEIDFNRETIVDEFVLSNDVSWTVHGIFCDAKGEGQTEGRGLDFKKELRQSVRANSLKGLIVSEAKSRWRIWQNRLRGLPRRIGAKSATEKPE